MRGPVRKELMGVFERELQAAWPQFELFDSERDSKTWSWKIAPRLQFFVTVQTLERTDQFVVEVSWSETGDFPWGAMGKVKVDQPQGREILGRLLEKSGRDEPVWDASPDKTAGIAEQLESLRAGERKSIPADEPLSQVLPRVLPLVRDAIGKLEEHGTELFRQVAEVRGITVGDRLKSVR